MTEWQVGKRLLIQYKDNTIREVIVLEIAGKYAKILFEGHHEWIQMGNYEVLQELPLPIEPPYEPYIVKWVYEPSRTPRYEEHTFFVG